MDDEILRQRYRRLYGVVWWFIVGMLCVGIGSVAAMVLYAAVWLWGGR